MMIDDRFHFHRFVSRSPGSLAPATPKAVVDCGLQMPECVLFFAPDKDAHMRSAVGIRFESEGICYKGTGTK